MKLWWEVNWFWFILPRIIILLDFICTARNPISFLLCHLNLDLFSMILFKNNIFPMHRVNILRVGILLLASCSSREFRKFTILILANTTIPTNARAVFPLLSGSCQVLSQITRQSNVYRSLRGFFYFTPCNVRLNKSVNFVEKTPQWLLCIVFTSIYHKSLKK